METLWTLWRETATRSVLIGCLGDIMKYKPHFYLMVILNPVGGWNGQSSGPGSARGPAVDHHIPSCSVLDWVS